MKDKNLVIIALSIIVALLVGFTVVSSVRQSFNLEEVVSKSWSAVFLTNGQVYFGHVSNSDDEYVTLKDIYYLKLNDKSLQPEAKDLKDAKISLIKLGKELHGPKDKMYINRDQILFIEELKNNSRIVQSINAFINK